MPSRDLEVPEDARAEGWAKAGKTGVAFTTGPHGKVTHWRQGVLLIDNTKDKPVSKKEGTKLAAELEYSVPEDNSRALTIGMSWKLDMEDTQHSQKWKMR